MLCKAFPLSHGIALFHMYTGFPTKLLIAEVIAVALTVESTISEKTGGK
jgi:hypothetical protein